MFELAGFALDPQLLAYGLAVGLLSGALAGTMAGLAGVGGGLIYVPLFYVCLPGESQTMAAQVFGSLVAVVITGFFSARSHWRLGHVDGHAFRLLIPGLVIGSGLGLWMTLQLPEYLVLLGLGLLDGWIAWDYGKQMVKGRAMPLVWISGPIGMISGSLGIGGGTMLVPLLRRQLALRHAVGTSAACGLVMAAVAVAMNLLFEAGWKQTLEQPFSFLIGAWLGILIILPRTSRWAASLHAGIPEARLRLLLKLVFALLSVLLLLAAAASLAGI